MDKKLRATLTECIRDIETGGATVESCLDRHPEQASELRGHLELWQTMIISPRAEPSPQGQRRGEEALLRAVRADEPARGRALLGRFGRFAPAMSTAGAAVAAVVLLVGGVAGASAALGGPDIVGTVASGIGISKASDTGKDNASDNAFMGADNASETGAENANDNAFEGADNADDGIDNASDQGKDHANDNAFEGSDNASEGADNASDNASEGADNADDGADNAPDDVPRGPPAPPPGGGKP